MQLTTSDAQHQDLSFPQRPQGSPLLCGVSYRLAVWLISLLLFAGVKPAHCQTINWSNINGGWWDVGSNWVGGAAPGSTQIARFSLNNLYAVDWDSTTGHTSTAGLQVLAGDVTFRSVSSSTWSHTVSGSVDVSAGNLWLGDSLATKFNLGFQQMLVEGGGLMRVRFGSILNQTSTNPSHSLFVRSFGTLNVSDGGVVNSHYGTIGSSTTTSGFAIVNGVGSQWSNSQHLQINNGVLEVKNGGTVSSQNFTAGVGAASGVASIEGAGSVLNVTNTLTLAQSGGGNGYLSVFDGGVINSLTGIIANGSGSTASVTVAGAGSLWENQGNLTFGNGAGTLNIDAGGTVISYGTTTIGANDSVILNGGRFEFGTMNLTGMNRISGASGSLAGTINHSGYTNVASLTEFQGFSLNMTDVSLRNSGGLYGNANLGSSLVNLAGGEVQTVGSERMRFAGGGTNAGRMDIYGGQISFGMNVFNSSIGEINNFGNSFVASEVWNAAGGMISGRGQFVAPNGWTNQGVMAFSGGATDILGDLVNMAGAKIVTSGHGTTTFYGDVVHNGSEIRTSAGSETVFFGSVSGSGPFTGTGTVFMEGDLRPGNSPGVVSFGGDLVLGTENTTHIELGGLNVGQFDQLLIAGDLSLNNSELDVSLIKGFRLDLNPKMRFLIASVGGTLSGQFAGLGEGSRIGNLDLYITYLGFGSGNGIGLYVDDRPRLWSGGFEAGVSAVPEPSCLIPLLGSMVVFASRRDRRTVISDQGLRSL